MSDDTLRDVNILLVEKGVYVDRIYVDVKDHFFVFIKTHFYMSFNLSLMPARRAVSVGGRRSLACLGVGPSICRGRSEKPCRCSCADAADHRFVVASAVTSAGHESAVTVDRWARGRRRCPRRFVSARRFASRAPHARCCRSSRSILIVVSYRAAYTSSPCAHVESSVFSAK